MARASAADAAGLVAGEAAEAVVTEQHVPEAVVLRTADVRARRRRREHEDRHEPARGDEHRDAHLHQPRNRATSCRAGEEVCGREARDHEERLQLLGEEAEADAAPASTSHRVRPSSIARVTPYAPTTRQSTRSASGLLYRKISAAAGVVAKTSTREQTRRRAPNQRRIVR